MSGWVIVWVEGQYWIFRVLDERSVSFKHLTLHVHLAVLCLFLYSEPDSWTFQSNLAIRGCPRGRVSYPQD